MPGYRCYLMTGESIRAVEILDCADDADAISRAAALLQARPEHQNIEIWEGPRMVARVPRHVVDGGK
jgi:hypothetical protein